MRSLDCFTRRIRELSDELIKLSATKLAAMIRAREVSPVEVVEAHLRQIERLNPKLNAIVTLAQHSLERAREAEAAIMRGDELKPLHGVPFTVKDTIETERLLTTSGSRLRSSHVPDRDALAVARLKKAGAILLGKTNVPEMAIPYECDNPVFGRTNNPHDLTKTSGGSSGGEAAAISACLSPIGLGSDLSGSIRVPAHFCGIMGLKPTTGRVPSAGHCPPIMGTISEGAVIGPMARTIEDLSLLLNLLSEQFVVRFVSSRPERTRYSMRGWRVAAYWGENYSPISVETRNAIHRALRALDQAGFVIVEETPPGIERLINLWPALFSLVSASHLRVIYSGHEEQAGKLALAVLASLKKSQPPTPDEFLGVRRELYDLQKALIEWMQATPLFIAPVGAVPAFRHGARQVDVEEETISVFRAFGYSRLANVVNLSSVSVPAGRTHDGLPIGVQVIGRGYQDEAVLVVASIIEDALGGWVQPPDVIA